MKERVEANPTLVRDLIEKLIPTVDESTRKKFVRYYEMLIDWNNRMNLTAITDPEGVVTRHFADSLIGESLIKLGASCIDVGTGAGFPGIPLKIIRPDIKLTLLDSLNKRIVFLNEVLKELNIDAETVHSRAEDGGHNPKYREKFDVALSRAVAGANILAEWTLPFVKNGGYSLMYKGPSVEDEIITAKNAFHTLNSNVELRYFEADWGRRAIIVANKYGKIAESYPRKAGIAEKKPL